MQFRSWKRLVSGEGISAHHLVVWCLVVTLGIPHSNDDMPDLFSIKSPLLIRNPLGNVKVAVACYPHESGLVFLEPFWNELDDFSGIHLIEGALSGEGPWKLGEYVITLLGCVNTHGEAAMLYREWQDALAVPGYVYPEETEAMAEIQRYLRALNLSVLE